MNTLFNAYLFVDWSASIKPSGGKDSIWLSYKVGRGKVHTFNPTTRAAAIEKITSLLANEKGRVLNKKSRVLLGFDFGFAYPQGTAQAMSLAAPYWKGIWHCLHKTIEDDARNCNNRFDVAATLRTTFALPFWGKPNNSSVALPAKKKRPQDALSEWRLVEEHLRQCKSSPKSQWQLYGAGSVGGQTLTGIPRLWQLRFDLFPDDMRVWPFETGTVREPKGRIILCEIYPGILDKNNLPDGCCADERQVKGMCQYFYQLDKSDALHDCFSLSSLSTEQRKIVKEEEGWVLGVL